MVRRNWYKVPLSLFPTQGHEYCTAPNNQVSISSVCLYLCTTPCSLTGISLKGLAMPGFQLSLFWHSLTAQSVPCIQYSSTFDCLHGVLFSTSGYECMDLALIPTCHSQCPAYPAVHPPIRGTVVDKMGTWQNLGTANCSNLCKMSCVPGLQFFPATVKVL